MVLSRPSGFEHAREAEARGHVLEAEPAGAGRRCEGEAGTQADEDERGSRQRSYLAVAMCLAQAASTFFHSASRASAFGARASIAIARDESRNACLATLVTTT